MELFRQRPSLAAELLSGQLGVRVPAYQQARLDSGDLPDVTPTEYRADTVVVLTDADRPVLAVVVEVQLRRDPRKRWSWPVYLSTLRARLSAPTVLLTLCPDRAVARWCADPISLGHPGWVLKPLVVGPERVPAVTDPVEARQNPELAVLSAMAHGSAEPEGEKVLSALLAGLRFVDDDQAKLYTDVVLAALPEAARVRLEELMAIGTYEYQSDFARRYYGQGRAEGEAKGRADGEAKALLAFLEARGIDVSAEARVRITECTDSDQLEAWVRRAVSIVSIDELFG